MPQMNAAQFVDKAANSNMFEIQSSQAAVNKTQNSEVRNFAQRMVTDHTQAGEKMQTAAQGVTIPTALDQEHAQMLQKLQQASGNEFDRPYVDAQVDGHQKAVALFEGYAQNGDNAQLKQFAQQTLPTLRDHLQQITRVRDEMSRSGATAQNQAARGGGQAMAGYMTEPRPGTWRASQLRGLNVYNNSNEKVGDINEILVDEDGKAEAVVIGVGGFLGLGEHDVAVPFKALQWVMTPVNASANTATNRPAAGGTNTSDSATGAATQSGSGMASNSSGTRSNQNDGPPDHALLPNASKDQLKNAPEFRYRGTR